MTYATLFSGVGGWDQGFEAAGFGKPLWMCEIGTFQRKVLAKRYPGVRVYEDVTRLHAAAFHDSLSELDGEAAPRLRDGNGEVAGHDGGIRERSRRDSHCSDCITERPDILVASPPCQDLSVAGKRAGLAGVRSGLFFDFVRLVRELQPTWLCMEQVPGLLSSNGGRDFEIAISALADAGYFVEWRVLDARWFGVPQRRRRVFVVGHLGGPPARSVLFEPEGSEWDSPSRAEAGTNVAYTLAASVRGTGDQHGNAWNSTYIPEVGRALTGTMGKRHDDDTDTLVAHVQGGSQQDQFVTPDGVVPTLAHASNTHGGHHQPKVVFGMDDIAHTLRGSGFDASEDGTGRGTPLVAMSIAEDQRTGAVYEMPHTHALAGAGGKPGQGYAAVRVDASVRRLTPTECERLMSWEDGWTCLCGADPYTTASCTCSDGPRYAAAGNGVVASVAAWVASNLKVAANV